MNDKVLKITEKIHSLFRQRGITLSVAESCTGGLISHRITSLPGASKFFRAGVTAYSEQAKKDILNISPETIHRHGMVSESMAREMAEKVRLLAHADYSLSTTGNLGPEALENKDQGLVYIAASRDGRTVSRELRLKGDRTRNKEQACLSALEFLDEFVESDEKDSR